MADDLIRYDLLVQDALRGVVRRVLTDAARDGLSGEHHFYISFRTEAPGVRMSQALREKYPHEMTIVLQHQFWDLGVTEHSFEVGLSFSNVPERLLVPFDALSGFFDPSVQFGLKFDLTEGEAAAPAKGAPRGAASEPGEVGPKDAAPGRGLATIGAPPRVPALPVPAAGSSAPAKLAAKDAGKEVGKETGKGTEPGAAPKEGRPAARKEGAGEAGAEVVSLDAFRKKN